MYLWKWNYKFCLLKLKTENKWFYDIVKILFMWKTMKLILRSSWKILLQLDLLPWQQICHKTVQFHKFRFHLVQSLQKFSWSWEFFLFIRFFLGDFDISCFFILPVFSVVMGNLRYIDCFRVSVTNQSNEVIIHHKILHLLHHMQQKN